MTKAMVTDDPNFKVNRDLDPNLGMYLEIENKLFSGNPGMRDAYHAAKINNAKLPSRNVMPAPQRFFDPEDKAFKPFLGDMGEQPGGRYLEMGAEGPKDITGEFPQRALIGVTPEGKPVMQVSKALLEGETRTDGRKIKTNLFKKKAGWKWTQVPQGFDPEPPSSFPLVSVEDGKQHYYTLQAEFPEGVELTRYEKSKSEPRLRPTKKGNVHLGNKVGEISVRGKNHPVYDKIEVYGLVGASTVGMLEEKDRDEIRTGGITRRLTAQAGGLQFTSTRKNKVPLGEKYNDEGERLYYWVPSLEGANTFKSTGTNDDRYRRLFGNQSRGGYFTEAEIRQAFDADKGMTTLSSQVDWENYWGYLTERQDLIDAGELDTGLDSFVDGRQAKMQFIEDAGGLRAAGGVKEAGQGLRAIQTDAYRASYADIVYGDTQQGLMEKYGIPQTLQLDDGSLYEFNGSSLTKTFAPDKQNTFEKAVDAGVGFAIGKALGPIGGSIVNKLRPEIGVSNNQQNPDLGADIRPEPFTPNVESTELDPSTITSEGSETKPFPNLENIVSGAGSTPDTKQQITPKGTLPSSQRGDKERRVGRAKGGKIDKKKMACNKPKRTPNHPKKSHVVKACKDGKEKIIRFGEQGAKTAGKPKAGESKRMKAKRKSFKARHRKNIKRGNMSAAYWADKVKW
jgi:hypothetical protein